MPKITQELFLSPDFQALTPGKKQLYIAMLAEVEEDGICRFDIDDAEAYGMNCVVMKQQRQALIDAGFIEYVSPSEFTVLHEGSGPGVKIPRDFLRSDRFQSLKMSTQLFYMALWLEAKDGICRFDPKTSKRYGFTHQLTLDYAEGIRQAGLLRCKDVNEYRLTPVEGLEVIS